LDTRGNVFQTEVDSSAGHELDFVRRDHCNYILAEGDSVSVVEIVEDHKAFFGFFKVYNVGVTRYPSVDDLENPDFILPEYMILHLLFLFLIVRDFQQLI